MANMRAEKGFFYTSAALYFSGLGIKEISRNTEQLNEWLGTDLHHDFAISGNQDVDTFLHDNLGSVAGAAFWAAGLNAIFFRSKKPELAAAGFGALITHKEIITDPMKYGNGVDAIDLFGGLAAMAFYIAFSNGSKVRNR